MNYKKIQVRTLEILDQAEGNDLTSKVCDYFILGLVFINIVAVVLESVSSLYNRYAFYFSMFELISVGLFTLEYTLRIWARGAQSDDHHGESGRGRLKYIFSFHGIIDLVAFCPSIFRSCCLDWTCAFCESYVCCGFLSCRIIPLL